MLALNMCPDQSQAFKEVNTSQAFTVGKKKKGYPFFLNDPRPGAPRHVCTKFSAKHSKNWLRSTSIKSYLTSQIEHILKPKYIRCDAVILAILPHESPNVHAVFQR